MTSPSLSGIFLTQDTNIKRGSVKAHQTRGREPGVANQAHRVQARSPQARSPQRSPQSGVVRRVSAGRACPSQSVGSRRSAQPCLASPPSKHRETRGSPVAASPSFVAGGSERGRSDRPSRSAVEARSQSAFDFGPAALKAAGMTSGLNSPRDECGKLEGEAKVQAQKTLMAVDSALRAVQAALTDVANSDERISSRRGPMSPSMSPPMSPDSAFGSIASIASFTSTASSIGSALSTASTATPRSCSKDSSSVRAASLQRARLSHKNKVKAEERSVKFNRGMLEKLDEIRHIPALCA
mmetsp:Transcript_75639/g.138315  ORF Transcript_75639/g.138315 Transcript_75639/m.138315 type:complete len:297 (+) Transcript_75639:108-998(+)